MTVQEQNDWANFKAHLDADISSRATSNKAILWIAIATLGMAVIALAITVSSMRSDIRALFESNKQLRSDMTALKQAYIKAEKDCKDAQRNYISNVRLLSENDKRLRNDIDTLQRSNLQCNYSLDIHLLRESDKQLRQDMTELKQSYGKVQKDCRKAQYAYNNAVTLWRNIH